MSQIRTLEQAIQAIEELQSQTSGTASKIQRLENLSEELLTAAQQALGESEKAREWARNMYRVDHYGYIWKWNTDTHLYEKTTSRICTPVIADEAITNEKVADGTLTGEKFADDSIDGEKIKDNSVPGSKLADGSIESVDIKDNTLEGSKLVNNTINGSKIKDNQIEGRHLIDNSIPGSKIKDGTIENVDIKDNTLDGAKIIDNTVDGAKIANGAINSDKLVNNSVTAAKIEDYDPESAEPTGVTTAKIADGAVGTSKIEDYDPNSETPTGVTTAKIADEAITEGKLADGAVTTAKLANGMIEKLQTITDDKPVSQSVKPIQSGSVFNAIAEAGVVNISEVNKVDTTPAVYSSLSDAITAVPAAYQRGGMSIKFVLRTNTGTEEEPVYVDEYVQYRLMSTAWSSNEGDWAVVDASFNESSTEWIRVVTDKDGRILCGIKHDGSIEWSVGVPQPVKDYVEEQIAAASPQDYNEVLAFLGELIHGETLQTLLTGLHNEVVVVGNSKVDKVEGKGLSSNDYTDSEKEIANSTTLEDAGDYIQMTVDRESKILEGITSDGTKNIELPLSINSGEVDVDGYHVKNDAENPEYIKVVTDDEGKLIYGVKKDGSLWCAKGVMADEDIKNFIADKMDEFPDSKYVPLLESLNRTVVVQTGGVINPDTTYKTLNLLTLADIHNSTPELSRFVGFANKYKDYLDDSIILGDIAGVSWVSYTDWDETVEGYGKVLKVLGNHDVYERYATFTVSGVSVVPVAGAKYRHNNYHSFTVKEVDITDGSGTIKCYQDEYSQNTTSGTLTKESGTGDDTITFSNVVISDATVEDCYNRYLKGVRTWGVSYIPNKCYYYKDYAKANVRLIVIDCMYFDDEQKEWLQDVLYGENNDNSALTLGRHVIIASHIQVGPFSSKKPWDCNFTYTDINVNIHNTTATNIVKTYVDTFQQRGGVFITYMFGHHHIDEIGDYTKNPSESYPNQIYIKYPTRSGGTSADTIELEGNPEYENVFTVTSIDTRLKLIRLLRIGVVFNRHLVHRESIVISYEDDNRRVVSQY